MISSGLKFKTTFIHFLDPISCLFIGTDISSLTPSRLNFSSPYSSVLLMYANEYEIGLFWSFIFTLAWQVLALSVGAIFLLMTMIKQGAAAKVGSYFYLVAPLVTIQAWFLFDETIGFSALVGVILISLGVAITSSKKSLRSIQS